MSRVLRRNITSIRRTICSNEIERIKKDNEEITQEEIDKILLEHPPLTFSEYEYDQGFNEE
jgi:hypothetical protein